jgi:hypothetical protein
MADAVNEYSLPSAGTGRHAAAFFPCIEEARPLSWWARHWARLRNNREEPDMSTTDTQLEAVATYLREHLPVPMMLPLLMKLQLLRLTD